MRSNPRERISRFGAAGFRSGCLWLIAVCFGLVAPAAATPAGAASYNLSVSWSGYEAAGTVTSSPAGIDCVYPGFAPSDCSASFVAGTQVTLTETTADGAAFLGWSGAGCSGTGPCTVTLAADSSITAMVAGPPPTYQAPPPPPMDVSVSLTGGGSGTVSGAGIACPGTCAASFPQAQQVFLAATPNPGSEFAGWSGAGTGTGTCMLTQSGTSQVTATFTVAPPAPSSGTTSGAPPSVKPCIVPRLMHETLAAARQALARRGCRLGEVTVSPRARRHHILHVTEQFTRPGLRRHHNFAVKVQLG